MKLLVICQYFHPDITAAAFRMSDGVEILARSGHEVRVISAVAHKADLKVGTAEAPPLPETLVYRCPLQPVVGSGFVPYLRHYLAFVRGSNAAAWRLRRTGWKPDVIWASSPPLFTAITGYAAARMFRIPWVLDVRDIWPDSAVAAGQLRDGGWAFRVGKQMERFFYARANHITCVSSPMQGYISGMTRTPVTVVYNGVKSSAIPGASGKTAPSVPARKVLLYAGNLGRVQGLDLLINAVAELERLGRMDGWEVRLVGAGALRDQLISSVNRLRLENRLKILPPMARSDAAREVSSADALFLSLKPDPALRMTVPSKLFDYLCANLPILAGIFGEGAEIARRTGGNIVYAPEDLESLKQALETLFLNLGDLKIRALDNSAIVRDYFTREKAMAALEDVFRNLSRSR